MADINSPSSLAELALLEPSLATPLSNAQTHKKNVYSDPKNMSNAADTVFMDKPSVQSDA